MPCSPLCLNLVQNDTGGIINLYYNTNQQKSNKQKHTSKYLYVFVKYYSQLAITVSYIHISHPPAGGAKRDPAKRGKLRN